MFQFLSSFFSRSWSGQAGKKVLRRKRRPFSTTGAVETDPNNDDLLPDLTRFISKASSNPIVHGSFGGVRKCTYITANCHLEVAVKSIRVGVGDDFNAGVTKRFLSDFRDRKQLQHENLLPLLGISYDFGPLPAMVSPWMDNDSLTTYLKCNFTTLTVEIQIQILRQVAGGLSYLHSKGVVHGDLTANNILIDSNCNARVADHGILIMCSELSGTSNIRSNVRWAAPEIFKLPENGESLNLIKPPSDVYSFGCVILQVMTGRRPYADVQSNYQVIRLIVNGTKPTRPLSPYIEDSLWDFIEACWSDAACRPSAIEALTFLGSYRNSCHRTSVQNLY